MSKIEITAVKRSKHNDKIDISFVRTMPDQKKATGTESFKTIPHKDFVAAFEKCTTHLAVIGEFVDHDETDLEEFHFSGFSIGGKDEDPGIILTGHKILSTKKALIFNTPFTKFVDTEKLQYEFMEGLRVCIAELTTEALLYVQGKKRGDDPQRSLFDEEPQETIEEGIDEHEDFDNDFAQENSGKSDESRSSSTRKKTSKKAPAKKAAKKVAPKKKAPVKKSTKKKK